MPTPQKFIPVVLNSGTVIIDPDEWPTLTAANEQSGLPGGHEARREWGMCCRRHADGRTMIYGWNARGERESPLGFVPVRSGVVAPAGTTTPALLVIVNNVAATCDTNDLAPMVRKGLTAALA